LLIKLELSLQINKLDLPEPEPVLPEAEADLLRGAEYRVSYMSKKLFAFADDCNVITTADPENLKNLTTILETFGEISGLQCNIQKTNILVIGDGNVPENIADLAFNLTDELTILGFKIENGDNNFRNNGNRILERIKKQVRIWSRYNLSLPGRIEISKTMLYSQLNYMGCIIPIP
jgi:hypothetical protein